VDERNFSQRFRPGGPVAVAAARTDYTHHDRAVSFL
jgi:hypothetical protein